MICLCVPFLLHIFFQGCQFHLMTSHPYPRPTQGFLGDSNGKVVPAMQETWVQCLGQEDLLEKGMAGHPSILARIIPRTEEPGRLQSMVLQRVRYD